MCYASLSYGQTEHLWNVKNAALNHVLDSVESKYKLNFVYDFDFVSKCRVTKRLPLNEESDRLLKLLFYGLPVTYEEINPGQVRLIPIPGAKPGQRSAQVLDGETKRPIPFVAVSFDDGRGTESDEAGRFVFDPQKTDTLRLFRLGYEQQKVLTSDMRDRPLEMRITSEPIDAVEIVGQEPGVLIDRLQGRIQINQRQLSRNNASVFTLDPLRSVQLLPGIQAFNDLSSDVHIRGGDAGESLIVLDGMTLYEAKHYYGIFSSINATVVDEIGVFKNQSPPELEGRTSGVVAITTYPNTDQDQGFLDAQIGLMNASLGTTFSVGPTIHLMGAFRSTTGNPGQSTFQKLLNPRPLERLENRTNTTNVVSQVPDYEFYDWNAKARINIGTQHHFELTTFHSSDETLLNYDRELKIDLQIGDIVLYNETYNEDGAWQNHAYQGKLELNLNDHTKWETRAFFSEANSFTALESQVFRRFSIDSTITGEYSNRIDNHIKDFHVFSNVSIEPISRQDVIGAFKVGADFQKIDNQFEIDYGREKQFQQDRVVNIASAFVSQEFNLNPKWRIQATGRLSHYSQTEQLYFFPQLSMSFELDQRNALKASYSSPAQMLQRAYYEDLTGRTYAFWITANMGQVPVSRSHKYMVGYQSVSDRFKWDVEIFHKKTNGMIELASNQIGFDPRTFTINSNTKIRIFDGERRTSGVDIMSIYEHHNYQAQLAYTFSRTDTRFLEIAQNTWFPSRDDRRHQMKLTQTYSIKNWSFQALWVFASGRPFSDISKILGNPRDRLETDPNVLQTRLKDYHRMDLSVALQIEGKSFDPYFSASVINILNRRNVKYAQYIFGQKAGNGNQQNTVAGTEWGLLDRTLNITAGLRF